MPKSKKVLLIQDVSNDESRLLQLALAKKDIKCQLMAFDSVEETVEFLFGEGQHKKRWLHDLPDIILLDIELATMDGYTVLRGI